MQAANITVMNEQPELVYEVAVYREDRPAVRALITVVAPTEPMAHAVAIYEAHMKPRFYFDDDDMCAVLNADTTRKWY